MGKMCGKMIESFQLEIFCCCCTLKTGSLVIGTLGWLLTLFQLFYLTSPLKQENNRYRDSETDITAQISYSLITLLVCVMMIIGVYKNNKRFILPWLVLKCMECIAWTVIILIVFVLFFIVEEILKTLFLFFIIFFVTTLNWYFWVCVWSLYMELTDKEDVQVIHVDDIALKQKDECPIESV